MRRLKWRKYCIVPTCDNTSRDSPPKMFFPVPKNDQMRDKWYAAVKRDKAYGTNSSSHYCCEDHFDLKQDLVNFWQLKLMGNVRGRLKKDAVPRKFLPETETVKLTDRTMSDRHRTRSKKKERLQQALENPPLPTSTVLLPVGKTETSDTATYLSNQTGPSTSSQLEHSDIKIEEHDLLPETLEEPDLSQPQSSNNTTDPLIKSESEDEEALPRKMEQSDVGPEALQLLPETSENPQRLMKLKAQFAVRSKNSAKIYCRLCFQQTSKNTMLPLGTLDLNYPGKSEAFKKKKLKQIEEVENMIQVCLPFYESLTFNPVICSTCLIRLKNYYEFTTKCLQNQQLITDYIESRGTHEGVVMMNEMMASNSTSPNVSKPPRKNSDIPKKKIPNLSKKVSNAPSDSFQKLSNNELETDSTKIQSSSQRRLSQDEPDADYRPTVKKQKIQPNLQEETLGGTSGDPSKDVTIKKELDHDYSLPTAEKLHDTSQKNVATTDPPIKIEPMDCSEFIKTEPVDEVEDIKRENETRTDVENSILLYQSNSHEAENDSSYSNSIIATEKGTKGSSLEHIEQTKLSAINNT